MPAAEYDHSVFVNCPFDDDYRHLFEAIVFAIHDCGYIARCALEVRDGSEIRISKIQRIIRDCRFGIHDISRTELDQTHNLPRFNMPLELGLFLGAKWFGADEQQEKSCLILDVDRYRFQKFISDLAGQDIASHGSEARKAVEKVRDFLQDATPKSVKIPAANRIWKRYELFRTELPAICRQLDLDAETLIFSDYVLQLEEWLKLNATLKS